MNIPPIGTTLKGEELASFLLTGIEEKRTDLIEHLSGFDGEDLFHKWREFIRCIDELINLKFTLHLSEWHQLELCDIDILQHKESYARVLMLIDNKFGRSVCERMKTIILMYACIKQTYHSLGHPGMDFNTVAGVVDFCQSRRLYYISYLSLIHLFAKGKERMPFIEILCHFQYQVDFNMAAITTGLHGIMGSLCLKDYAGVVEPCGIKFNTPYNQLEGFFLEAQTMNEVDILAHNDESMQHLNSGVPRGLYSYEELSNSVKQAENLFGEYGIGGSKVLHDIKLLIEELEKMIVDGYAVCLSKEEFYLLSGRYPHLKLNNTANDYYDVINERPAFFQYKNHYYSSVLLMERYVVNVIYNELLRKNRRYRIKAGFMFEKKVVSLLERYGFEKTEVKRIKHHEFDVICLREGVAYNFQCKNNYIDINALSPVNLKRVAHRNNYLANYYRKALEMENKRSDLIKEKFGVAKAENYVVSRFPIMIDDERVLAFNGLEARLKND